MKLSEWAGHPGNPRRISDEQAAMLAKSLDKFGDLSGLVYNERTRRLVGGHMRKEEFPPDTPIEIEERFIEPTRCGTTALGYVTWDGEKFAVRIVNWDEETELAANLAANKHGGEWEPKLLADILLELDQKNYDLELTGFNEKEIEDICAPYRTMPENEDVVPEVPKVAKTRRGELWLLGQHKLLIDDCTVKENVERLMGGEKADMVFTDPPYGVNAVHNRRVGYSAPIGFGKTRGENYPGMVEAKSYLPVANDDRPFDPTPILSLAPHCLLFGANYFHDKIPLGWRWVVWDKKAAIGTDEGPFSDCELAWTNLEGRAVKIYRHLWAGLLRAGDRKEEMVERVHPTQKPVGLCAEMLSDLSKSEAAIIDPFLGSGSTVIACEKTGRKCYGMEIEPLYGDVILDRFQKYSGIEPKREDGLTWSELKGQEVTESA